MTPYTYADLVIREGEAEIVPYPDYEKWLTVAGELGQTPGRVIASTCNGKEGWRWNSARVSAAHRLLAAAFGLSPKPPFHAEPASERPS